MKERILTSLITAFVFATMQSQTSPIAPKLVIGLTIDQLRTDYMEAFSALYGERGFKRLLKEGCVYYNGEYDFINVDLSSSVAALYTGTTPYYNGILANRWMDRRSLRLVNSVSDPSYMGIYTSEFTSPQHLQVSTLSDELKVSTNGDAEIYSISPTREMAIFAAGHAANGAFWLNDETGKWCGSTYYGGFPEWVSSYNDRDGLDFRIDNITWGPYLPVTSYQYVASEVKQLSFEHDFSDERADKYRKFKTSPYVNDEVNRLVNACFANTNIGKDNVPDLLTIGYYGGNYDGCCIGFNKKKLEELFKKQYPSSSRIGEIKYDLPLDPEFGISVTHTVTTTPSTLKIYEDGYGTYKQWNDSMAKELYLSTDMFGFLFRKAFDYRDENEIRFSIYDSSESPKFIHDIDSAIELIIFGYKIDSEKAFEHDLQTQATVYRLYFESPYRLVNNAINQHWTKGYGRLEKITTSETMFLKRYNSMKDKLPNDDKLKFLEFYSYLEQKRDITILNQA